MEASQIKKITNQLCKYKLTTYFKSTQKLNDWLNNLTPSEIKNIINLTISPEELLFPKELLINKSLLSCLDYQKRIFAMSKLKNASGCWHLFEHLCSPNFINSKYYYQDLAIISTAPTAKYALSIIDNDIFLNSKYHTEDLILIIESINPKLNNDIKVTESLIEVATNKESINSPYHRQDMDFIFKSNNNNIQIYGLYSKNNFNNLAINPVSLKDPYHLENMEILSQNPLSSEFIYDLMTNEKIVTGKYYRDEIKALINAKSIITAIAIYYYICNPQDNFCLETSSFSLYDYDPSDETHQILDYCYRYQKRTNNLPGNFNPEYLKNLNLLNEIDDKILPYFESLLSNKLLINSPYYYQDLKLFQEITDYDILRSLYQLMTSYSSLNSPYHFQDAMLISETTNDKNRKLLLKKALDDNSINSTYHEYDMKYLSKLNLSKIKPNIYDRVIYYLFHPDGLCSQYHIIALETLSKGELYNSEEFLDEELNNTPNSLISPTSNNDDFFLDETYPKEKIITRIKKIFTK